MCRCITNSCHSKNKNPSNVRPGGYAWQFCAYSGKVPTQDSAYPRASQSWFLSVISSAWAHDMVLELPKEFAIAVSSRWADIHWVCWTCLAEQGQELSPVR